MLLAPSFLLGSILSTVSFQKTALLEAVPEDAFALIHAVNPPAFRARAQQNDWVSLAGGPAGKPALTALAHEYEAATGTDFHGLIDLALKLHGEALLFFTGEVAGFLTEAPPNSEDLADALRGWMKEEPSHDVPVAGGLAQVATWTESRPDSPSGGQERSVLAFLDHPRALGLFSGDDVDTVLKVMARSLEGFANEHRAPVVESFLAAGGGRSTGVEAFVDFTPFVDEFERNLRSLVQNVLPDPTGLLGLDRGTWLFARADVQPGTEVTLEAQLRIPEGTLAADLADTWEPLPASFPDQLPRDTWGLWAVDWNLGRFLRIARAAFEKVDENGLLLVDQGIAVAKNLSGVDPLEDVLHQMDGLFAFFQRASSKHSGPTAIAGQGFLAGMVAGHRFLETLKTLLGEEGLGIDPGTLEGATTFLLEPETASTDDGPAADTVPRDYFEDGGLALLPRHLVVSPNRETMVETLRAIQGHEEARLEEGSPLRRTLEEHRGSCGFAFAELAPFRAMVLAEEAATASNDTDPFQSRLTMTARRTSKGFEFQLSTR